ncbi:lipid-A-disaccharide synthase N-terminal domain-containing protein [bacterium]|nr:lipid-A-disaccharide synthase N-terminal domain-containing protein [bacterium]
MRSFWLVFGFAGQLFFSARFFIQWLASEKAKQSVIPFSFWWFSIGGAFVLLIYAIHLRDPVFILGQSTGFLIYSRNIYFIRKKRANG